MMASTPSDPRKITVGRTRPAAGASSTFAASPHTPLNRSISGSAFNSPSASFRIDDENLLIFEIGARVLRAGFAGESKPRCELYYNPQQLRRVGDYRHYASDYVGVSEKRPSTSPDWSRPGYELWTPDVRDQDLNFLGERLDRLVREVESTYLLLDSRPRKVALVASSQLPKALLELVLSSLFSILQSPSIALFPCNVMTTVAAGLRSALVIDIGWSETAVSAIFEYREVLQKRSVRAGKSVVQAYSQAFEEMPNMTVDEAEEILVRSAWCSTSGRSVSEDQDEEVPTVQIGTISIKTSRKALSAPIDRILFASDASDYGLDDHDLPVHLLAYNILLQIPLDIRRICMSRIVVTGGLSNLPGLKTRILEELKALVTQRGWTAVRNHGSATNNLARRADILAHDIGRQDAQPASTTKHSQSTTSPREEPAVAVPAHLVPQETDPILAKLQSKNSGKVVEGTIRGVHTLGAWAGASLMNAFRIKGVAEVDRERFLSSGLTNHPGKPSNTNRTGAAERTSWTLGIWG